MGTQHLNFAQKNLRRVWNLGCSDLFILYYKWRSIYEKRIIDLVQTDDRELFDILSHHSNVKIGKTWGISKLFHSRNILIFPHPLNPFSFIFGRRPLLDTGPFALNPELKLAFGEDWRHFVTTSLKAFHVLQKPDNCARLRDCALHAFSFLNAQHEISAFLHSSLFVDVEGGRREGEARMDVAALNIEKKLERAVGHPITRTKRLARGIKSKLGLL